MTPLPWKATRGCVYQIRYHLVWSTKYRLPVLTDPVAAWLKVEHERIANSYGWHILAQEIMSDHVHLFVDAPPKWPPSTLVKLFKGISARHVF